MVTGVSQVAFPGNANGQQIYVGGKLIGSKIIGQQFTDPVLKNGKPEMQERHPGDHAGPALLPEPALGHRAAL